MLIDVVVEKLHPVGYIETLPDGTRLAPVNEAGNEAAETKWEVRPFFRLGAYNCC